MKSDAPLSPSFQPPAAEHQYFAASRPVVGTVAACSFLLFVCSWFAIGNGSLWPTRDAGTHDPVRIDVPSRPNDAVRAGATTPAPHRGAPHTAATPSGHELVGHRGTSANPTAPTRIAPERATAQKPAPAATAAPTGPSAPSPTPAPAADQPRVIVETPQSPAPLGGLPEVSVTVPLPQLPPATLPVTPPSLPKVPVVSDVTASLGLS